MHYLEDLDPQENDLVGTVLCGKWRVLHRVGRGGMSTVYAAEHRNGRRVAIKVLRRVLAANRRIVARFLKEGYVANKIRHPGAVAILDDDVDSDGTVFLVMELLDGATLSERYGGATPASLGEILRVAERLLDVLVAAHDGGVVHRDIKPSNVFLTNDDAVMLLDFGIARLLDSEGEAGSTHSGATLGTPGFMAPEQARGRGNLVDARTDIWAVGALLFFLLTGKTVHEAETPNELLIASATQPPRSIGELCVGLPDPVAALVDRALDMDRDRRWPDARSMQDALVSARIGISETLLGRCVDRAAGTGGAATVPETHTAEPSVVSRKDRGRSLPTPSTSSTRSGALAWVIGTAALMIAAAATLVVRTMDDPSPSPEAASAPQSGAATTAQIPIPPAAGTQEQPPAPVRVEPTEVQRPVPPPVTDDRPKKSALKPNAASPATQTSPPAATPAPVSTPASSAVVDILDVRR
jgi:eukaryotic-like serine/threonine-protein kinase